MSKRKTNVDYKHKLLNYYSTGKKTNSPARGKKTISGSKTLITKQFDNGTTLLIPNENDQFEEYDIMGKGTKLASAYSIEPNQDFVEYDLVSKEFSQKKNSCCDACNDNGKQVHAQSLDSDVDFSGEAFVESFEERKNEPSYYPEKNTSTPSIRKEKESPYASGDPHIPYPKNPKQYHNQPEEERALKEDDLIADMKSILGGQTVYDPVSKKMVNKAELARQKMVEPTPIPKAATKAPEPEPKPIDQKNEHEIFDKIRQSMQFANAYDLGSISMEKRFQDFDSLSDIKEKDKSENKKPSATVNQAVDTNIQKPGHGPVSSLEFIQDLDQVKRKAAATAFQNPPVPAKDWCLIKHHIVRTLEEEQNDVWRDYSKTPVVIKKENDKDTGGSFIMKDAIKEYWKAVRGTKASPPDHQNIDPEAFALGSCKDSIAWSAAFVSWVMKYSGIEESDGFAFSQRHITYIVQALRNRYANSGAGDPAKPIWLYDNNEALVPGDILCSNREGTSFTFNSLKKKYVDDDSTVDIATIKGSQHCDIVKEIINDGGKRYVIVVGGNKSTDGSANGRTVNDSRFEVDQNNVLVDKSHHYAIIKLTECRNPGFGIEPVVKPNA